MSIEHGVFIPEPIGWNKAFKSWEGTVGLFLGARLEVAANVARAKSPKPSVISASNRSHRSYSTGRMVASIYTDKTHTLLGDLDGRIVVNVPYAIYVHEGTRPHVIRAKRPDGHLVFNVFPVGGRIFARKVKHPGTRANPFLREALFTTFKDVTIG